jgi:tetratricopeptide (TPR) repeat protein
MNLRNAWNYVRSHRTALMSAAGVTLAALGLIAIILRIDWLCWIIAPAFLIVLIVAFTPRFMCRWHEAHGARELSLNQPSNAEKRYRMALQWAESIGLDSLWVNRILEQLVQVARKQGSYDDAEAFARDWLLAEQRAYGNDHPRAAHAMEQLAEIYNHIARHHQARPLLEDALRVREAHQQKQPAEYVRCLDALGSLWCRLERFDLAEPFFRKAVAVVQQNPDHDSPDSFAAASGLSTVCVHLDKVAEADALAQSALTLAEENPEPASLPVAFCLSQLAYVRRFQDRFEEAEELLRRAMDIVKRAVPNHAMLTHGDLHLLGVILRYQSRWAEAEECFQEVLRLRQEYCAPEDLSIARVLEDYADLLELMGRLDEAAMHQNHAKQIRDFHSPFRLV